MSGIQLVYFHLVDSSTNINNIELAFTEQFEFKIFDFDKERLKFKLIINEKEKYSKLPKDFWDKNDCISRIDLLVGENGAGKSTILSCLGCNLVSETIWFAIYLEVIDDEYRWFFNANMDYDIEIEILGNWSKERAIRPKSIYDTSLVSYYRPNIWNTQWVHNFGIYDDDTMSMLHNKPLAVYSFITKESKILQQYFSAENISYQFRIDCDIYSLQKYYENTELDKGIRNILSIAISMIKKIKNLKLDPISKFMSKGSNVPEEIVEYRRYISSLMVECFYKNYHSQYYLRIFEMNILVCWLCHLTKSLNNKKKSIIHTHFQGNSIVEFNNYLINLLKSINKQNVNDKETYDILELYLDNKFINKLFTAIKKGIVKVRIPSTGRFEFSIKVNEKRSMKETNTILGLIEFTNSLKLNFNNRRDNRNAMTLIDVGYCNISSGEMAYIDLFSSIYEVISLGEGDISDEEYRGYSTADNYLILLDEPDATFHPEWSRRLIYYLTTFINSIIGESKKKCQIIITTHSPFIVSDLPPNYVTCINLELDRNGHYVRSVRKAKQSFAANIYELLNDGFFMNAPIGEFAQRKVQIIIERINALDILSIEEISEEIECINTMIDMISDKLVRARLKELMKKKTSSLNIEKPETTEYLLYEINMLKKEIEKLKNNINSGEIQ